MGIRRSVAGKWFNLLFRLPTDPPVPSYALGMTNESELRTVSDAFLARLGRLQELEDEKRLLTPGSDRMIALAAEIRVVASDVLGVANTQLNLARDAADVSGLRPIEAIPPREAHIVLADWRAAERRMTDATPGSAEDAIARADIDRLRAEYQRTFERQAGNAR